MTGARDFDPEAPRRLRHATCDGLLQWVIQDLEDWTKGSLQEGSNLILLSIFSRSTRTYSAIVRSLGENGYGEQTMMLGRSLFEDMIDLHWTSLNPDLAAERLLDHDLNSRLLRADTQRKHSRWFDGKKPPKIKVTNEKRRDLIKLYGRSGSGSWTGVRNLDERVESVLDCWDEDGRDALLFWHAWVVRLMNETLHSSAFSLARSGGATVKVDDQGESLEWQIGNSPQWLPQGMHAAFWTYSQSLSLILDEFHPASRPDFDDRQRAGQASFERADLWEKVKAYEDLPSDQASG